MVAAGGRKATALDCEEAGQGALTGCWHQGRDYDTADVGALEIFWMYPVGRPFHGTIGDSDAGGGVGLAQGVSRV